MAPIPLLAIVLFVGAVIAVPLSIKYGKTAELILVVLGFGGMITLFLGVVQLSNGTLHPWPWALVTAAALAAVSCAGFLSLHRRSDAHAPAA